MIYQLKIFIAALIIIGFAFTGCEEATGPVKASVKEAATAMAKAVSKEKLLRHMVIFKFNDSASVEDVNRLNESFNNVAKSIPVVKDFEWGLNDSPEDFDQDFTHCYMLTFESETDRDSIYSPHPVHQAFVASLGGYVEKVFVVDYWTNP